ncbi:MAG: hypothetical protein HY315_01955 [Acidobacteria bacterium]|nr:hypothetical protein [Acidobacteriota bacterium]
MKALLCRKEDGVVVEEREIPDGQEPPPSLTRLAAGESKVFLFWRTERQQGATLAVYEEE